MKVKMYGLQFGHDYDEFEAEIEMDLGLFTSYELAFKKQMELNKKIFEESKNWKYKSCVDFVYETGYTEDTYPKSNTILAEADKKLDWDTYYTELKKHQIYFDVNPTEFCNAINKDFYPPFGYYRVAEIELEIHG